MEQAFIKLLDKNLVCTDYQIRGDKFVLIAESDKKEVICPFCGNLSSKIHSVYQREIQDIPMRDKQTILLLKTRKIFCLNKNCTHKTFTERFDFVVNSSITI